MLVLFTTIVGAGIAFIIYYVSSLAKINDNYLILGIAAGIGAISGLILGFFILIGLKRNFIEEYGVSYGIGVSTNIFIGGIVGGSFGSVTGALFGLILQAINYTANTDYRLPIYGMLVWIVLGLNIGILVGIFASFGIIDIVYGGLIAGVFVGPIGVIAVFGPDITSLFGAIAGLIVGAFIAVFVKFSVNASVGTQDELKCGFGSRILSATSVRNAKKQRNITYCGPKYYLSDSNCSSYFMNRSGCGISCLTSLGGLESIILLFSIPIIILISIISWISAKASISFGKNIRKGGLTAIGSSVSIMLLIGSNIGLTTGNHDIAVYFIVLIGAGLGVIFGSIILVAIILSARLGAIEITPETIIWKDRYTAGGEIFYNIENIKFQEKEHMEESRFEDTQDFVVLEMMDGRSVRILLNCWDVPNTAKNSFEYLRTIIQHYYQQAKLEDYLAEELTTEKTAEITRLQIRKVENAIGNTSKINIHWVSKTTNLPITTITEIAEKKLNKQIIDDQIIDKDLPK